MFSFGLRGALVYISFSLGSATNPAEAAKSINNSNIIIWIGARGIGIPKRTGKRNINIKATLTAR